MGPRGPLPTHSKTEAAQLFHPFILSPLPVDWPTPAEAGRHTPPRGPTPPAPEQQSCDEEQEDESEYDSWDEDEEDEDDEMTAEARAAAAEQLRQLLSSCCSRRPLKGRRQRRKLPRLL